MILNWAERGTGFLKCKILPTGTQPQADSLWRTSFEKHHSDFQKAGWICTVLTSWACSEILIALISFCPAFSRVPVCLLSWQSLKDPAVLCRFLMGFQVIGSERQ